MKLHAKNFACRSVMDSNRLFMDFTSSEEATEQVNDNICLLSDCVAYTFHTPDLVHNICIGVLKYVHERVYASLATHKPCLFTMCMMSMSILISVCVQTYRCHLSAVSLVCSSSLAILAQSSCLVHWTFNSHPLPPGVGPPPCSPVSLGSGLLPNGASLNASSCKHPSTR